MRINSLAVKNYKSLRAIFFAPSDVTVVIGANAAGKSNLADCIDFIAEVYRHGLEVAIARKGGYENIAFRKVRRSKKPITIEVSCELDWRDVHTTRKQQRKSPSHDKFRVDHSYSFVARGYSIKAPFGVVNERVTISGWVDGGWQVLSELIRELDNIDIRTEHAPQEFRGRVTQEFYDDPYDLEEMNLFLLRSEGVGNTELIVSALGRFVPVLRGFVRRMEGVRVFQLSPTKSREHGVPTPRPELSRAGDNLPAVIELMKKTNKEDLVGGDERNARDNTWLD